MGGLSGQPPVGPVASACSVRSASSLRRATRNSSRRTSSRPSFGGRPSVFAWRATALKRTPRSRRWSRVFALTLGVTVVSRNFRRTYSDTVSPLRAAAFWTRAFSRARIRTRTRCVRRFPGAFRGRPPRALRGGGALGFSSIEACGFSLEHRLGRLRMGAGTSGTGRFLCIRKHYLPRRSGPLGGVRRSVFGAGGRTSLSDSRFDPP